MVLGLLPVAPVAANEILSQQIDEVVAEPLSSSTGGDFAAPEEILDTIDVHATEEVVESSTEAVNEDLVTETSTEEPAPAIVNELAATSSSNQPVVAATGTDDILESIAPVEESTIEDYDWIDEYDELLSEYDEDVSEERDVDQDYPVYSVSSSNSGGYQFNQSDCVVIEDGSYYCATPSEEMKTAPINAFYSQPDISGDLEIFANLNGEERQLTTNLYDDSAPYYDAISNTVVWHRLIDDRYQIVSYDLATAKEVVITDDLVNNMEPARFGAVTVWQRWVGNNWEIMLHDGKRTEQITTSVFHDINPSIRGEYVLWKTIKNDTQVVSVYDMVTKLTTTINDADTDSVMSNPRLVLVYDSVTGSGDTITKGYDPITGELVSLAALPFELPEELPSSENTGETRALIQNKNPLTDENEIVIDDNEAGDDGTGSEISFVDESAPTSTLVVTASSTPTVGIEADSSPDDLVVPANEDRSVTGDEAYTIEISPLSSASEQPLADQEVEALVIPPFTATTTDL